MILGFQGQNQIVQATTLLQKDRKKNPIKGKTRGTDDDGEGSQDAVIDNSDDGDGDSTVVTSVSEWSSL